MLYSKLSKGCFGIVLGLSLGFSGYAFASAFTVGQVGQPTTGLLPGVPGSAVHHVPSVLGYQKAPFQTPALVRAQAAAHVYRAFPLAVDKFQLQPAALAVKTVGMANGIGGVGLHTAQPGLFARGVATFAAHGK